MWFMHFLILFMFSALGITFHTLGLFLSPPSRASFVTLLHWVLLLLCFIITTVISCHTCENDLLLNTHGIKTYIEFNSKLIYLSPSLSFSSFVCVLVWSQVLPFPSQVVYNRVGKCGSRTVVILLRLLAEKHQFNLVSSDIHNKTRLTKHEQVTTLWWSGGSRLFLMIIYSLCG